MAASLQEIEEELEQELARLQPRQRKFALLYGDGGKSQMEAAISAGYSSHGIERNAHRVAKSTRKALSLIRKRSELINGESLDTHRSKLLNLFELCATPDSPTWEPRTAHAIRRTLLEIDGIIKNTGNSAPNITINVIDPVAEITVDSDTYPGSAVIEHEGDGEGEIR